MTMTNDEQQFFQLLENTMSMDNAVRQQAEVNFLNFLNFLNKLNILSNNNDNNNKKATLGSIQFDHKIVYLVKCMSVQSLSDPIRILSLVLLRRLLSSSDEDWHTLNSETRSLIQSELLNALQLETNSKIRKKITDVIAELAKILMDDDGYNQWQDVLKFLFDMSSSPNVCLRESSLNIFTFVIFLNFFLKLFFLNFSKINLNFEGVFPAFLEVKKELILKLFINCYFVHCRIQIKLLVS
jgi:importin-5